jgi:hypothetical protein
MTNRYALLLAAVAVWAVACGDDDDDDCRLGCPIKYAVFDGGKYERTDGGALCAVRTRHYAVDATIEVHEDVKGQLDQCVPSCGPQRRNIEGELSIESLPAGACTTDPPCDMGAYAPCRCDHDDGPVSGYRCLCRAGQWTCLNTSQGAAICACEADPGTD